MWILPSEIEMALVSVEEIRVDKFTVYFSSDLLRKARV